MEEEEGERERDNWADLAGVNARKLVFDSKQNYIK